jgi:hypothetical protein
MHGQLRFHDIVKTYDELAMQENLPRAARIDSILLLASAMIDVGWQSLVDYLGLGTMRRVTRIKAIDDVMISQV